MDRLSPDAYYKRNKMFGPKDKRFYCEICRNGGEYIKHRHHSTEHAKQCYKVHGANSSPCPDCKEEHNLADSDGEQNLNLITSSSTLHDAFIGNYKAKTCYDMLTICGARMAALRRAFFNQHKNGKRQIRILCVAGLNDVRNTAVKDFKKEKNKWKT